MLKQTSNESNLITPQMVKKSFEQIKADALVNGSDVNQALKTFNSLVTLMKWKRNHIFLEAIRVLVEINVVDNTLSLKVFKAGKEPSGIVGCNLIDSWNSFSYLVSYEESDEMLWDGFLRHFTVKKAIKQIEKFVFKPILKHINQIALSDSSIFLTNIGDDNDNAYLNLNDNTNDVVYNTDMFDFKDFNRFNEKRWLFSGRMDVQDKFYENIMVPINMISAENIIKLLTTDSGPMFDTPGLMFYSYDDVGKMMYYLDFKQYADLEHLVDLINKQHLIYLFPKLDYWESSFDKFQSLVLEDVNNFNYSNLLECFKGKYSFELNSKKTLPNDDFNYIVWMLFEKIALKIKDNCSLDIQAQYVKMIWKFVEEYFINPRFKNIEHMFQYAFDYPLEGVLTKSRTITRTDLDDEGDGEGAFDDTPIQRILTAVDSKLHCKPTDNKEYSTRYIFDYDKVKQQLESLNNKDAYAHFNKNEVKILMKIINESVPTTKNLDEIAVKHVKINDDKFFVNYLMQNNILR